MIWLKQWLLIPLGLLGVALAAYPNNQVDYLPQYKAEIEAVGSPIQYYSGPIKRCESNGDPKAIGDNGRARTQWQFHAGTFLTYGKKYGILPADFELADVHNLFENPDPETAKMAETIATTMITQEGKDGLVHWTCWRIEKLN